MLDKLCIVNFYSYGFSDISIKAIRRLMPCMFQGISIEEACQLSGYIKKDDSDNLKRKFAPKAASHEADLGSNSLSSMAGHKRIQAPEMSNITNPVVIKVLNKFTSLVNKLIDRYGHFDSIHIELARELWMSAKERERYYSQNQCNQ